MFVLLGIDDEGYSLQECYNFVRFAIPSRRHDDGCCIIYVCFVFIIHLTCICGIYIYILARRAHCVTLCIGSLQRSQRRQCVAALQAAAGFGGCCQREFCSTTSLCR